MKGTLGLCTILLTALAATVSRAKGAAHFPFAVCYDPTEDYKASTAYKQSVNSLLLALRRNASLTGFGTAVAGQPPNRVYGTILCYGDASSEDCRGCIYNATEGTDSVCESWVMWYDHCMVRYSPSNFIGVLDTEDVVSGTNPDSPDTSDPALFNTQLLTLLTNLTTTAAGNRSEMKYATGNISVTAGQTIHGWVQCTRDISLNDCGTCLANLTSRIQTCCNEKTDVFISSGTCIIRYQVPQLPSSDANPREKNPQLPSSSSARIGLYWIRNDILVAIISTISTAALCLGIPHSFSL
ncbi:cysteine-rich repeat secretory protein 38-like [Nymphaea colorata]|nr:cysteine-rich repeat secretory protein 38-like [Nymphaea colorata]